MSSFINFRGREPPLLADINIPSKIHWRLLNLKGIRCCSGPKLYLPGLTRCHRNGEKYLRFAPSASTTRSRSLPLPFAFISRAPLSLLSRAHACTQSTAGFGRSGVDGGAPPAPRPAGGAPPPAAPCLSRRDRADPGARRRPTSGRALPLSSRPRPPLCFCRWPPGVVSDGGRISVVRDSAAGSRARGSLSLSLGARVLSSRQK